MSNGNGSTPLSKEVYGSFGCLIHEEDFYSAEYYNPQLHWEHFIEDLEWNERMARRALGLDGEVSD